MDYAQPPVVSYSKAEDTNRRRQNGRSILHENLEGQTAIYTRPLPNPLLNLGSSKATNQYPPMRHRLSTLEPSLYRAGSLVAPYAMASFSSLPPPPQAPSLLYRPPMSATSDTPTLPSIDPLRVRQGFSSGETITRVSQDRAGGHQAWSAHSRAGSYSATLAPSHSRFDSITKKIEAGADDRSAAHLRMLEKLIATLDEDFSGSEEDMSSGAETSSSTKNLEPARARWGPNKRDSGTSAAEHSDNRSVLVHTAPSQHKDNKKGLKKKSAAKRRHNVKYDRLQALLTTPWRVHSPSWVTDDKDDGGSSSPSEQPLMNFRPNYTLGSSHKPGSGKLGHRKPPRGKGDDDDAAADDGDASSDTAPVQRRAKTVQYSGAIKVNTPHSSLENTRPGVEEQKLRPYVPQLRFTGGNTPSYLAPPAIGGTMSASDIISQLVQHGCQNITKSLDLSTCTKHPISTGGFGDIYRCKLKDGSLVAIKCMRVLFGSPEGQKHLKHAAREIHTWSKCKHRHVLQLLGMVKFRDQIGMVSPWVARGSLNNYLAENREMNRPWLCMQVAEGLAYLHSCGLVHGDLKGANVLLSDDGDPLLTDFGNATIQERTLQFTYTTAKTSLSPRWTAPELFHGEESFSFEADVFALGMTILEIITGSVPYSGMNDFRVMYTIAEGRFPDRPENSIPTKSKQGDVLWSILTRCWHRAAKSRPSASAVKDEMMTIQPEGLLAAIS